MKQRLLFIIFLIAVSGIAQVKKIELVSADISTADEEKYPGATILMGNVRIRHQGAVLDCKRALLYRDQNIFNAVGEVVLEQGDSIIQYSDFALYNGNTKMLKSWGNVEANDKTMKLSTDTIYFDRNKQVLYYPTNGKITDKKNTLRSTRGTYYAKEKKFSAIGNVKITNPDNTINSNHLDYYTHTKLAYLYGATTITNLKDSTRIYTEKGFYNTNTDISYFVKNTKLYLKEGRTIAADSIYYDKRKGFASATNNIKVIDTTNNMITKGNYAEIFEQKDSLFLTKRAVGITLQEKDSMFIHGDTIMLTGKPGKRIARIYRNVKLFKSNLQGQCDSLVSNEVSGFTKMYFKPVLWSEKSQITGDSIQFLSSKKSKQLDSIFVYKHAFMIQQDSIDKSNFNQIKGRNMYGKFENNTIKKLLVKGNAESIYFNREEKQNKLQTITKEIASDIEFTFSNNEIEETKYFKKSEGKTYPPSKFPDSDKKFNGFIWREKERPKTKYDIFKTNSTKPFESNNELKEIKKAKEQLKQLKENNRITD